MNGKINADEVTQYELETWTRCAEGYQDTFAGLTGKMIPPLIDIAEIISGSHVLDIGSGPGLVAEAFTNIGATVAGIDFSPQMVQVARKRYPHIAFEEANAEHIPFDSGTFDVVVSNYVVHHFARPGVVFREICRVLKPGGRFIFAVWGAPEEQSSIGAFFGAVGVHHNIEELPHGPLFGVTEISVFEPLLTQAGLENCQLSLHEVTWGTISLDPILQGFWDWGNMAALPTDIQEKIKETTIENCQPYKQDGNFVFPHSALLGMALKP